MLARRGHQLIVSVEHLACGTGLVYPWLSRLFSLCPLDAACRGAGSLLKVVEPQLDPLHGYTWNMLLYHKRG